MIFLVTMLVAIAFLAYQRSESLVALTSTGVAIEDFPSSPVISPTVSSKFAGYLQSWRFEPRHSSAYLTQSPELRSRIAVNDPSITSVGIKTTSPQHRPIAIRWSPRGDRLAILTSINELRIYRWQQGRLSLESVSHAENELDEFRNICWHPTQDALVVASNNFLMTATPSPNGSLRFEMQPLDVGRIEAIEAIRVDDRGLIVITTPQRILGWDVELNQYVHSLCEKGSRLFAAAGQDPRYVVRTDVAIEVWRASLTPTVRTNASISKREWKFSKVQDLDVRQANAIEKLAMNRDGSQIMVQRADMVMLRQTDNLDLVGGLRPSVPGKNFFCEFTPMSNEQMSSLFFVVGTRLYRGNITPTPAARNSESWDTQTTEIQGGRLADAMLAHHPTEHLVAVSYAGGVEVWNHELETVDQLPGVASVEMIEPMPLQDLRVAFRGDGSAVALDSAGQFAGRVIPNCDTNLLGMGHVTMHQVDSGTGEILQTNKAGPTRPQRRRLSDYGIQIELSTPHRDIPGIAEYRNRVSAAPDENHLLRNDDADNDQAWDVDPPRDQPTLHGKRDDRSSHRRVALQHDGKKLFMADEDSLGVHVIAIDVESGQELWRHVSPQLAGPSNLSPLADGNLLVTNWTDWLLLDGNTGESQPGISPRENFGFRHRWSRVSPFDHSVITWHDHVSIEPAASWSPAMELKYLLFTTESNSWITLAPDGTVLDTISPDSRGMTRYVGKSSRELQPARWADSAKPRSIDPAGSLSIIRYHDDSRITIQAF